MRAIACLSFCAFLFASCQNEQKNLQNAVKSVDSIPAAPQIVYERPTFLFTSTMDSMETPRSVVSFAYGKTVEKIDTTVNGDFKLLDAVERKQMKIPKSYIVAGKAFWAGLQVVLAIDSTANGYIVKRQYEDETSKGHEPFETIKSFPK